MNKFLTFPGIQPIYLGDIDFLQDSVRQAFRQLLVGLTGSDTPNCILKKATATVDGVICLDGEIMPYKAYTGTNTGTYAYDVVSAYSGTRQFKNGETHECYEERYAQEKVVIGGAYIPTFDELISARIVFKKNSTTIFDENLQGSLSLVKLGTSVLAEMYVEFTGEGEKEYLLNNVLVNIPSTAANLAPKYCLFAASTSGVLVTIPAEVTFAVHPGTAQLSYMTVKIAKTTFAAGDKGTLNLNILL